MPPSEGSDNGGYWVKWRWASANSRDARSAATKPSLAASTSGGGNLTRLLTCDIRGSRCGRLPSAADNRVSLGGMDIP